VQRQLGELDATRTLTGRALGIFGRRLGPDHLYTAQCSGSCQEPQGSVY